MWPFKRGCKYIWKTTKTIELDKVEHWSSIGGMIDVDYFQEYAKYQTCLVCEDKRIIKKSRLC